MQACREHCHQEIDLQCKDAVRDDVHQDRLGEDHSGLIGLRLRRLRAGHSSGLRVAL